ncbi:MAG: TonB family protein [Candidatus Sulfotelmatobacter sp.]
MFEFKTLVPKTNHYLFAAWQSRNSPEPKQRRMMVLALTLLLVALGVVLFRDRDFWFPNAQDADDQQELQSPPAAPTTPTKAAVATPSSAPKSPHRDKPQPPASAPVDASAPPVATTTARTVLPPLEVEVVAGNVARTVQPRSNSVRVDLKPGSPPQQVVEAPSPSGAHDTAAAVTRKAAERVQMSVGTAEVVSHPVTPDYPMLARQMKVQGSVILRALISRDGLIQDLHVLSGPPILASAAREAVKQWHFKPHYQGADPVETQTYITVNFTISTN